MGLGLTGRSRGDSDDGADATALTLTHAVRMVVQDMGNGVDRVVHASFIPLEDAHVEAKMDGREPMMFPYPERFRGLLRDSVRAMGMCPVNKEGMVLEAFARCIDERTIEIVTWCRL